MKTAVGLAAMALGLASCETGGTVADYTVEQRAVFEDGGQEIVRTQRVVCRIVWHGAEDRRFVEPIGPPITLPRADGAIAVINAEHACPWVEPPTAGAVEDTLATVGNREILVYDDARRPTRVSLFGPSGGGDGPTLTALTSTVVDDPSPDSTFERDFPGWPDYRREGLHSSPAILRPGRWVSVYTQMRPLPEGGCAGQTPIVIDQSAALPACAEYGDGAPPAFVVMAADPDPRFRRVVLSDLPPSRTGPDRFSAEVIRDAGAPTAPHEDGDSWAPEVCLDTGFCITGAQAVQGVVIIDPASGRVVYVSMSGDSVSDSIARRLDRD